ncbi:MAG TPA: hypothetical protein VHD83_23735 [Puia sp.]|nr:hypothetical protein [Puia sp.]
MKILRILTVSILFTHVSDLAKAQNGAPYEVLRVLAIQMNPKFPVLDSLYPFHSTDFNGAAWAILSKDEKRELKKRTKQSFGVKISSDSLTGTTLIPALPVFMAFAKADSPSLRFIEQTQPFYMISAPVFIHNNTKAVVFLSLIKRFGTTYILQKKDRKWTILKDIYEWMQ